MKLLDVYNLIEQGQVTDEQAAEALDLSHRQWEMRKKKWGHRLPLLFSILDKIKEDKITRLEAAQILGTTERNVNSLMQSWGVVRPLKPYLVARAAAEVKWEIRKKMAIDFIAGATTIEDAAEGAEVSDRQMRRWVSELLHKHFGMVFKDLKPLQLRRRQRLAEEVEEAERLELAKQQQLKAVLSGQKTIQEEALERAVARREARRAHVR